MLCDYRTIQFIILILENLFWFPPTPTAKIMLPYLESEFTNNPASLSQPKELMDHSLQLYAPHSSL
jgi:hypothetical protein